MKIKKYINRTFLVRLGLFLVLLTGAWLYDHFHQGKQAEATENHAAGTGTASEYPGFYCTPQAAVSLKAPMQKNTTGRIYQEKLNRLLSEQQNIRSLFLRKAEMLKQPDSRFINRNLVSFRYHFLHYPDDQPPV